MVVPLIGIEIRDVVVCAKTVSRSHRTKIKKFYVRATLDYPSTRESSSKIQSANTTRLG